MTEHSHIGGQQLHKNRRQDNYESSMIVSQNPIIGCLSSTTQNPPLAISADQEISCSQSSVILEHLTDLEISNKVMQKDVTKFDHGFTNHVFSKTCTYVLFGALLAVGLLGSVGFLVMHLSFSDIHGNHDSYDVRVLLVKRLMRDSPLIGKQLHSFVWNTNIILHIQYSRRSQ